ncbi:rod shape-determining protein MreC [Thermophilibacter immobilis]|uniref:Cell shape-determining protein MreC n=1 Tax=Thermophilibacter immobilis TaxID=2779519 RepID=A0A7S7M700_9ACTN|nr:rod shape-determining protein MreC [Thermophilibacter immobilis]QOY59891.1 rod shape-determining protein MreC [Thermophilibacter immobilis]
MPYSGRGRTASPTIGSNRQSSGTRTLAACVAISLALFTLSVRMGASGPLEGVRGAFSLVTTPVRYLGATVAAPFQGIGNVVTNLTADQATLSELQDQNAQLQARNVELEEAEQEAERLRGLLDLSDANNLQSTAARIISGSTDSWSTTVTIDKGTSSGLSAGMPVTSESGVIGQIVTCGATTSTVRLLTDENSAISAMTQSSRAQGMLCGSASGQVNLTLVRTSQSVSVGDVVVTSGLGGVFPKGLPIGKVTSVENSPGSLYLSVVVEPLAQSGSYEEVLVITSLTEEQKATADDITAADAQENDDAASAQAETDADAAATTDASAEGTATTATTE